MIFLSGLLYLKLRDARPTIVGKDGSRLQAGVAKQVDASALGAGEATRGGSSPSARIRFATSH